MGTGAPSVVAAAVAPSASAATGSDCGRRWGKKGSVKSASEVLDTALASAQAAHPAACSPAPPTDDVGSAQAQMQVRVKDAFPESSAVEQSPSLHPQKSCCFAVLDFEATCDDVRNPVPQEVIEFPIVLVDRSTGASVSEYRTFVRPVCHPHLTSFCKNLTGIKQSDVNEAPEWRESLALMQGWLDAELARLGFDGCIFVTCGDWDLKTMMPQQCKVAGCHVPERFQRWLNIKDLFRKATGNPGKGMKDMLDALKLDLQGHHHSGLDDSRNIARILQVLLRRGIDVDELLKSNVM